MGKQLSESFYGQNGGDTLHAKVKVPVYLLPYLQKQQKIKESLYQDSLISSAQYPVLLLQTLQGLESHIQLSYTVSQP